VRACVRARACVWLAKGNIYRLMFVHFVCTFNLYLVLNAYTQMKDGVAHNAAIFGYEHTLANFHDFLSMPESFCNHKILRGTRSDRVRFASETAGGRVVTTGYESLELRVRKPTQRPEASLPVHLCGTCTQ
jgi:hypothetical protein